MDEMEQGFDQMQEDTFDTEGFDQEIPMEEQEAEKIQPQEGEESSQEETRPESGQQENNTILRQQIEQEERQKAQQRVDQVVAQQYGKQMNPYTGNYITTEAELLNYQEQYAREKQAEQFTNAGIDPNLVNQLISQNPAVQQAEAYVKEMQTKQLEDFMSGEVSGLLQKYPDCGIQNVRDLETTEEGQKVLKIWSSGVSLQDAYAAVNVNSILGKKTAAAKQSAINQMTGKGHMQRTPSGGAGSDITIPPEVREEYKAFFPDWTEEQIAKEYSKFMKG